MLARRLRDPATSSPPTCSRQTEPGQPETARRWCSGSSRPRPEDPVDETDSIWSGKNPLNREFSTERSSPA